MSRKASQIESEVFKLFNSVDKPYKSKITSLYLNLKDKSNPHLREKVINDVISPVEFCNMSATVCILNIYNYRIQYLFINIKNENIIIVMINFIKIRKWPLKKRKKKSKRFKIKIYF